MSLLRTALRWVFLRPTASQALPGHAALAPARAVLVNAGVPEAAVARVRRYAVSSEGRYCAMTLENDESYVVDLALDRHVHCPRAGVARFEGARLILEPDEARFALEPAWCDDLIVDLQSDAVSWVPTDAPVAATVPR